MTCRDVLDQWLTEVNKGNAKAVAALYAEDAMLLPTFAPNCRTDQEGRRAYFRGGGQNDRVSVELTGDVTEHASSDSASALSGLYTWAFLKDGVSRQAQARYTFVIDLSQSGPIVQHHSSVVPN